MYKHVQEAKQIHEKKTNCKNLYLPPPVGKLIGRACGGGGYNYIYCVFFLFIKLKFWKTVIEQANTRYIGIYHKIMILYIGKVILWLRYRISLQFLHILIGKIPTNHNICRHM